MLAEALPFARFLEQFWLDEDGRPQAAPWTAPSFAAELQNAQVAALASGDWRLALTLGHAAYASQGVHLAPAWLVEWAVGYTQGRPMLESERVGQAEAQVRSAIAEVRPIASSPHDIVAACFCLLEPDAPRLPPDIVDGVIELMDVSGGVARFVRTWVEVRREGDPEEALRFELGAARALDTPDPPIEVLEEDLRKDIKRLTLAAGGNIQRTHCRAAWDKLMVEALPVLQSIASGAVDDKTAKNLAILPKRAGKIFDSSGAKFQDRRHMDKAVTTLVTRAEAVLQTRAQAVLRRRKKAANDQRFDEISIEALRHPPSDVAGPGALFLALVGARFGLAEPAPRDLSWGKDDVAVRPLLLEAWKGYDLADLHLDTRGAHDHRTAAARLLRPPCEVPVDDLLLWMAGRRPDLLGEAVELNPEVTRRVQARQRQVEEATARATSRLRMLHLELAELADLQHQIAHEALRMAEALEDGTEKFEHSPGSGPIRRAWLEHTVEALTERVGQLDQRLREEALLDGHPREEVERMVAAGQRAALIRVVRRHPVAVRHHRLRATLFRPVAALRWPLPAQAMKRDASSQGGDPAANEFIRTWNDLRMQLRRQAATDAESDKLRRSFLDYFLRARARNRLNRVGHKTPRTATHYSQVEMSDVRSWLESVAPNPNFLPQLARFRQFTVKVVPVETEGRAFARQVAQEGAEGELTILLAPGVEAAQLKAAKEQLSARSRWSAVAVIDDLDLCRVVNPGDEAPEPLLALMEIVAEQQPWGRFCPYEVVEGQHIKLEMFVGRVKEAEALAHQVTYGRIFSGRRLGKTALLRFVGGNASLGKLPSGNTLEVIFCSIAGMEGESAVAGAIEKAVEERFGAAARGFGTPIERLDDLFARVFASRPQASVLCLLDEADTFYAEQTASVASDRQASLSWWMSRHAERVVDAAQLPRIRFVFSGYLCTDQNRGVWENKGDVLLLKPLDAEDAVLLAAAPLARVGVDAADQADDIAFRCGYQPAVITRFGQELVEHLDRTRPRQSREMATVESRDVITVFQSNEVQRSIREACWLNFVGHPLGQLVFSGLLIVLRNRPPGAAVEDAPSLIWDAVREVERNFDPAIVGSGSWEDVVYHLLRELVDRSLLVQAEYTPAAFRLRFPHHLPVLLQEDPARYVKAALARIRAGAAGRSQAWVLPTAALGAISVALGPVGSHLEIHAAAVASHWQGPLLDNDGGLLQRLEIPVAEAISRLHTGSEALALIRSPERRKPPMLAVGGTELARAAAHRQHRLGDVDLIRTGRLSEEQVSGWIQRKRAAEFTAMDIDPMKGIMKRTGGVPILVAELDRWFETKAESAPSLGKADVGRLLKWLDAGVERARRTLADGAEALTRREVELVQLVVAACDDHGPDFRVAIQEALVEIEGVMPLSPDDTPSLRTLLALGLLPRAPAGTGSALEEVGAVGPDDPVRDLVGLRG